MKTFTNQYFSCYFYIVFTSFLFFVFLLKGVSRLNNVLESYMKEPEPQWEEGIKECIIQDVNQLV